MIRYNKLNLKTIRLVNSLNESVFISLDNTKTINSKKLLKITNKKCKFIIYGGIKNIDFKPRYRKRITYSLGEMKKIISRFEEIEQYYGESKKNNIIFVYDYIRKNIKYFEDEKCDKKIRSLCVVYTLKAVCSGYALLLKELLDRMNVKCKYIKKYNHSWNEICINKKYYEVDLTWDSCIYNKCPSSNLHYFSNNKDICLKHYGKKTLKNYYHNDATGDYKLNVINFKREDGTKFNLTLLPIGFKQKYYLYEEKDEKYLISSMDDMELILVEYSKPIQKSYINCFFTLERIKKYYDFDKKLSNLGYGLIKDKCFYRKKCNQKDDYIIKIEFDSTIRIYTEDYLYLIDNNYVINRLGGFYVEGS